MANILATPERIRQAIKDWIDETDTDIIEFVYNQNFDGEIHYNPEVGLFEVPEEEARRIGLDL